MGYPEEYGLVDGGGKNEIGGGVGGGEACVPLEVTIIADHWPKETSWVVKTTDFGDVVAEANSDGLDPGKAVKFIECVNNRNGCYEFTIKGESIIKSQFIFSPRHLNHYLLELQQRYGRGWNLLWAWQW